MSNVERELAWDDVIENDSEEFVIFDDGDYPFEVIGFERARYAGGEKIPACNQAVIKIKVTGPKGSASWEETLLLHTKTGWVLCAFFKSIGQRQTGQKLKMDWNKVPGAKGKCHVSPRSYKNKQGEERHANKVTKWIDADAKQSAGYTPGKF